MTFRLTSAAEQDLAAIVDYIDAEVGPDRAHSVLDEILDAAEMLAEMPRIGHARRDLTDEAVLCWPVYSYLIVYRPAELPLEVVRVVHGSRDPKAIDAALRGADPAS